MFGFPAAGYAGLGRLNGLREPMGSTNPPIWDCVGGGEEGGRELWVIVDGGGGD